MLKTIDLCAGIGGIRKGFEMTGQFTNVLSAEIDKYARMTYMGLYGEEPWEDLTTEAFKEEVELTDYDVLLAGFPCQTFSRAGLKEGFENEEKGIIFFHIADIILRKRPKGFLLENVDHLLTHNRGETFRKIINILEINLDYKVIGVERNDKNELKYDPQAFKRNSKFFGVPQNRPRTYIMGFDRKKYSSELLDKLDKTLPEKGKGPAYVDLNDILDMGADSKYYMSSGYWETLLKHRKREHGRGNGFGYKIVNSPEIKHPIANTILATGGSGKERNLIYDPQDKIRGMVISRKKSPLNDDCIRVMTPKEWGKLQGFINYAFGKGETDIFKFPAEVSEAQQYKQFGNSVTIPVVKEMAEFMITCFKKLHDENIE